jgi:glyoxylase-like metal-dependent hydrolase (beta-lactamase superfamily II)
MFSDYKDFGGVKFPTHIVQTQSGHPVLDLTVADVKINPPVTIDMPENIKTAAQPTGAPAPVQVTKVADGVIFMNGQGVNGSAIAFKDYVVMWEVSDNDAWATNRIAAIRKEFPGKPIRYVVNTHHHSDHSGGIRTAMAEGFTIITSEQNKDWWEKVAAMQHTINPDRLSKDPKPPVFEFVADKKVLTDGARTLEIHRLQNFAHADDMLVGYLPKEKILFEADMYDPPAANQPRPKVTPPVLNPRQVYLLSEIERLKLNVKQFVPGHGGIAPFDDLPLITGKKPVKAAAAN